MLNKNTQLKIWLKTIVCLLLGIIFLFPVILIVMK